MASVRGIGKAESPDVLVMTATPIPRTLALTLYGDLEVSVLDELPPGRKPVRTEARGERARQKIYAFLRDEMTAGRQVYVVCPLVEESEVSDLRAATEMAERLQGQALSAPPASRARGARALQELLHPHVGGGGRGWPATHRGDDGDQ